MANNNQRPVLHYKVTSLPTNPLPDAIFYVKPTASSKVSVYITDIHGNPVPLKDLNNGQDGVDTITNSDGNLVITGTTDVDITISPSLLDIINSALQSGDNISELVNDVGYATETYVDSIQYTRILATNKTGNTIFKGSVVYISGAQGSNPTIALSLADTNDITSKAIGIVSTDIVNNAIGYVYTNGLIEDLDTSAFNEGDFLYLSPTVYGGLTTTIPTSPNQVVFIGTCIRQHITQGEILIDIQTTFRLDRLKDVDVDNATTDQVLYKDTDGFWRAKTIETLEQRIPVNDTNYTITGTTNQLIAYTNITADRIVSLPIATTANQRIWITDESGLASNARRIIVAPNGGDTIGGDPFAAITFPNGSGYFESNGAGKWNIISTTSIQFSAGVNTLPSITDNGDGTATIGTGIYSMFANANGIGRPKAYQIAGGTFSMTDQTTNYIIAQYNTSTGTVSVTATTVESSINNITIIPIYKIYRDGTILHIADYDTLGLALSNKIQRSFEKTQPYRFQVGEVLLGESATRIITIGGGTIWNGGNGIPLTSVTSSAQTCYQFVNTSGVWSKSIVTQYNNTQYNAVGGLTTLTNNRYAVNYVFRSVGNDNDLAFVLGTGDYILGEAQTAAIPANLPTFITSHMVFVGRIIVQKSASTAAQIDSANTTGALFTTAGITDHNALTNLQLAQLGVTWGHINDTSQTIAGTKTFSSDLIVNGHTVGRGGGNISSNTVVGLNGLANNTSGSSNTIIGQNALYGNTTGFGNAAIGLDAGRFIADGSTLNTNSFNSVYLGWGTRSFLQNQVNEIVIGSGALGIGSNTAVLGNDSITKTVLKGNVLIGTSTDNGVDKLQINGSAIATAWKTTGGTSSQMTMGDGSLKSVGTIVKTRKDITGTTYTLLISDVDKILYTTNAAGCVITVPSGLTSSQEYEIEQYTTGVVSYVTSGTTLRYPSWAIATHAEQYSRVILSWIDTETYQLFGDLQMI